MSDSFSRDYYWKRDGWRWRVYRNVGGKHETIPCLPKFWRWRRAAEVCNAIFEGYNDGVDTQRRRYRAPPLSPQCRRLG